MPLTYAQRLMVNTNKQPTPAPSTRPQPSAAAVVPAAAPAPVQAAPEAKPPAPAPYNGIPNGNHHTENGCALCWSAHLSRVVDLPRASPCLGMWPFDIASINSGRCLIFLIFGEQVLQPR